MMEAVIILLILIGISILISIKYMLKTKQDLQVIIDEKNMAMDVKKQSSCNTSNIYHYPGPGYQLYIYEGY